MSEEWTIDVGFVSEGAYYEIHLRDEMGEPVKFTTATSEAEVLERVRELLPRLRVTESAAPSPAVKE